MLSRLIPLAALMAAVPPIRPNAALAAPPTAADIIAAADKVRSPQGAYRVSAGLVEYVNGKPRDRVDLAVHAKLYPDKRYKNLVRCTCAAPAAPHPQ